MIIFAQGNYPHKWGHCNTFSCYEPLVITVSCVADIMQKFFCDRIENVTRSPLFSHVTTTVQGLGTIRAYKKEGEFLRE